MTDEQLTQLEALASVVPTGTWEIHQSAFDILITIGTHIVVGSLGISSYGDGPRIARFITAACTAVPHLIAEVRRLRAALAQEEQIVTDVLTEVMHELKMGAQFDNITLAIAARIALQRLKG